jgi:hypothetical protein
LSGDEAVFKVLRWTGGNFELNFEGKTDQETTKLNTQGLLMEGLRLLDESQRDGGVEAGAEAVGETVESAAIASSSGEAGAGGTSTSAGSSAAGGRTEEEEDVLLDS